MKMKSFEEFKLMKEVVANTTGLPGGSDSEFADMEDDERAGVYYQTPDYEDGNEFQNLDREAGPPEAGHWTQKVTSLMDYIGDSFDPKEVQHLIHLLQQHAKDQSSWNSRPQYHATDWRPGQTPTQPPQPDLR